MDERANNYFDELVSQDAIDRDKDFTINADELNALSQTPHEESSGGIDATEYMSTRTAPDEATMNVVLKPFATHENTSLPTEDEGNSILQEMEDNISRIQGIDNTPFIDASEYSVSGADATDADEDFEIGFSFDASDTIPFEDDGKFIPLEVVTPFHASRKDPSFDNDDGAVIPDEEANLKPYATAENTSYQPETPAVAASVTGRVETEELPETDPALATRPEPKSAKTTKTKAKAKKPRTTMHGKKTITGEEPAKTEEPKQAAAEAPAEQPQQPEAVAQTVSDEIPVVYDIEGEGNNSTDLNVFADTSALDASDAQEAAPEPEAPASAPFSAPFEMPENLFENQNSTFTDSPADFMGQAGYENDLDYTSMRGSEAEGTSSVYADVNEYASTEHDSEFTLPFEEVPIPKRRRAAKSKKAAEEPAKPAAPAEGETLESVIANALNNSNTTETAAKPAATRSRRRKLATSPEEESASRVTSADDVADAISAFFAREDAKTKQGAAAPKEKTQETANEAPAEPPVRPAKRRRTAAAVAAENVAAATATAAASTASSASAESTQSTESAFPDMKSTAASTAEGIGAASEGITGTGAPRRRTRSRLSQLSEEVAAAAESTTSASDNPATAPASTDTAVAPIESTARPEAEEKPVTEEAKSKEGTTKRAGSRRVTRRQVQGPVLDTSSDTIEVINVDIDDDILETEDIEDSPEFRNTVDADPHVIRDLSDTSQKRPEEQTSYAEEIAAMAAQRRAAVAEAARQEERRNTEHMGQVRTTYGSNQAQNDYGATPAPTQKRPMTASQKIAARRPSLTDPIGFDPKLDQDPFEYKFDKKKKKPRWQSLLKDFLLVIVLPVLIALFLVNFVIISAKVPSGSMIPTINEGDRLFGFRLAYVFSSPKRGDIIIFEYPDEPKRLFIKRIIGLPGETISFRNGKVYITPPGGAEYELDESAYLDPNILTTNNTGESYVVPANHYFVMGDNRINSHDSRFWNNHFVSIDAIKAKAGLIFWPFSDFGFVK
ncbi:MAG: signal peptidase I [Lachnospiraceae bacterium]|nr:signal peptidase I [Lachnospiraceae bacterium]